MRKPCCDRKQNVRGAWSEQEDQRLTDYIQKHGHGRWRSLAKAAGLRRCGKSCRLRWMNYLKPDIKKGNFGEDEDDLIIKLHALLGNRWSLIAGRLPGRTDNQVKNYWNTQLSRKLKKPLTPKDSSCDGCCSSLSENQQDIIRSSFNSSSSCNMDHDVDSSVSVTRHVELPDLNLELTMT
ncbi:unnamed protein product [Rhodiola kirilowii]